MTDLRNYANGCLVGGEKVDIDIKQVEKSRKYEVYLNNEFVDYIYNRPDYHNQGISSLLIGDAESLVTKKNLMPKGKLAIRIGFIGYVEHLKNH